MSDLKKPNSEGIRPMGNTNIFKVINAELNTRQNKILLGLGIATALGVIGYAAYVRQKYENLGYYMAIKEDGETEFIKKTSNWES